MVDVTFEEKEGVLTKTGEDGSTTTRYVPESDLLALKGSAKGDGEKAEAAVVAAKLESDTALKTANDSMSVEKNKALQAEARVSTLEEQIARGGGTAAELSVAKTELEIAKTSSATLNEKFFALQKGIVMQTYNVPKETMDIYTDLPSLEAFAAALKVTHGNKTIGNFAVGAGNAGAVVPGSKSVMQQSVDAYAAK